MKSAESGIVEVEQLIQELRQSFCQHMISLDLYLAGGQLQRVCGQLPNKSVFRYNYKWFVQSRKTSLPMSFRLFLLLLNFSIWEVRYKG